MPETLNHIADSVRGVISYDAAGVFLLDAESHTLDCVVARGYGESDEAAVTLTINDGIVGRVITTGEGALVPEVADDPHYVNWREQTRSLMAVPIHGEDRIIGAFSLESDRPDNFDEKDLEELTELATRAAVALDETVLRRGSFEKKRLDEELRVAREVQLSLLPQVAPQSDDIDIAGINVPARNVGGDYFDFIPIAPGHLGVVVADVSGKGVPASLIMASFRAFLRAEVRYSYAIRTIFTRVSNFLHEFLQPHQFVTALYGVLDLERLRFTYSNAGHHPAILLRMNGKQQCLATGGTVLGVFADTSYEEQFVDLLPGDLLVLYTDGLVEAANGAGEMFDRRRLEGFVRAHEHLPAREMCAAIYAEMRRFTESHLLQDDTTIVVAKILRTDNVESIH